MARGSVFFCSECGFESVKWLGQCPSCKAWNSMEEMELNKKAPKAGIINKKSLPGAVYLDDIEINENDRYLSGMSELDRVLGGGIVAGSVILIGGDPGIGKSTILLQVCRNLALDGKIVLYISGEESLKQIKLRAKRIGSISGELKFLCETDTDKIENVILSEKPDVAVIDSIQTMLNPSINSAPGSITQVRESAAKLMQTAKLNSVAMFLVGHVTKEGQVAGPRVLEHMVDAVLYFEGERQHTFRILRAVKNRFGSTNEIGIFEMQSGGLVEVLNPSQVFLEERLDGATGSSIVVTMEGTRPILAEVQALVTPTMFGNAKRTTAGLDFNRASLIMAVLEKRAGLLLQNQDAYLKSAGGVRLDEPAIDLAVAVAIASSYKEKPTNPQECYIGEIGLTGEIRRVNRIEQRINEAVKLGFTKIYVPKNSLNGLNIPEKTEVIGVTTIGEVLKKVFG
mgnify:CR=1 FL=1